MNTYLLGIYQSRYFWVHLALSDLRAKWRRSFFGVAWSIMQPLGMTALIAMVFSRIFHQNIGDYAPYILSGMIIWDFITATLIGGSLSFVQADAYIKQYQHPLAIYTLRTALTNLMVLMMASLALIGWILVVKPENFGWCWFVGPFGIPSRCYGGVAASNLPWLCGSAFSRPAPCIGPHIAGDVVCVAHLF